MFSEIQKKTQNQFKEILKTGILYKVDVDRDEIWKIYLEAFSEDKQQENKCNCCKSYLRSYGGIVGIKDNKVVTLWDFETDDPEYQEPIRALRRYVKSRPITAPFYNDFPKIGTNKTPDTKRGIVWNHYYLELPNQFVKRDTGSIEGQARDDRNVLQRSVEEITSDAVDTVLELISQNSLYRGQEFKGIVSKLKEIQQKAKKLRDDEKDGFFWKESATCGSAVARIRNSAIGTLLKDLSEGRELDSAVTAFEKVVAPSNYKRPTALITPRMIEEARKRLEELGLTNALNRRILSDKDLNVQNVLFVNRPIPKGADIFDQLKENVTVNPKSLSKVEEISITDFVEKVLPTAKSISVLVENKHLGNFATLVGPQEQDETTLFKWGNNYSWSYVGNVADSMRARVEELGGRVDGVLRFTHSWNHPEMGRNTSLMDLHVFLPGSSKHDDGCHDRYPSGQRVGWNNRNDHLSRGTQDVDYTGAAPEGYIPIENITFPKMSNLKDGKYIFKIHNWQHRTGTTSGFKAEIEFGGEIYRYEHPKALKNKEWVTLAEATLKNGVFEIEHKLSSEAATQTKFNIGTQKFHKVKSICLSPNYWNAAIGNKHYFFILENCKAEDVRGFYNEFLKEELSKDRKVFEILGSKLVVEPVENELSGLGFSETVRNSLIVKVEGNFTRTLKINF